MLVGLIGAIFFAFGILGLWGVFAHGVTHIHRLVISIAAFVIGGTMLSLYIQDPDMVMVRLRMEENRWKVHSNVRSSNLTEFCVPSMRNGLPVTE